MFQLLEVTVACISGAAIFLFVGAPVFYYLQLWGDRLAGTSESLYEQIATQRFKISDFLLTPMYAGALDQNRKAEGFHKQLGTLDELPWFKDNLYLVLERSPGNPILTAMVDVHWELNALTPSRILELRLIDLVGRATDPAHLSPEKPQAEIEIAMLKGPVPDWEVEFSVLRRKNEANFAGKTD